VSRILGISAYYHARTARVDDWRKISLLTDGALGAAMFVHFHLLENVRKPNGSDALMHGSLQKSRLI